MVSPIFVLRKFVLFSHKKTVRTNVRWLSARIKYPLRHGRAVPPLPEGEALKCVYLTALAQKFLVTFYKKQLDSQQTPVPTTLSVGCRRHLSRRARL